MTPAAMHAMRATTPTVDLRDVTAALHPQPDVQVLEAVPPQQEHGLESLEPQDVGLHELQGRSCVTIPPHGLLRIGERIAEWLTVQLDAAISRLAVCDGDRRLLQRRTKLE